MNKKLHSGQALRHSSGQALRHSSGQALRHSSGQALRHSSGQALRHSSGQALRHSSGQALRHSSGQALLLILLAMAVVLTVVLSVVSKSVTDVAITTYEVDSLRAFSAAEAGIEEALSLSTVGSIEESDRIDLPESGSYTYNIAAAPPPVGTIYQYPQPLESGQSTTIWFVSHDEDGNLACSDDGSNCTKTSEMNLCWGNQNLDDDTAIEISVFYDESKEFLNGDFSGVKVKKYVYDPNSDTRQYNNFEDPGSSEVPSCNDYEYWIADDKKINFANDISCAVNDNCLIFMKVRMLYNEDPQPFAVPDLSLPSQGLDVSSTGTDGEVTRKVQVFQAYPEAPEIFDNVLFTEGSI